MSLTQKKFNLYVPKSKLAYISDLSDEMVSEFTRADIQEYKDEWPTLEDNKKQDYAISREVTSAVREGLNLLFGNDSKQSKYFARNIDNGETIVDAHYGVFCEPDYTESKIASAKLKVKTQTLSSGLDETNVKDLNTAIQYLTENEFQFGRDFTAYNAVDMAKSIYFQNCVDDTSKIKLSHPTGKCGECEEEIEVERANIESNTVGCGCYNNQDLKIAFEDSDIVFKVTASEN